ncbi:MAG: hypothetical protein R3C39_13845 [Dehalococcoidia bacterium]
MTTHNPAPHDPPPDLERRTSEAFDTLGRGAPTLDSQAVWARISPEVAAGRRSNGWRATLQSLFTTRALTAAGVAAVAVVAATALTLSSGGGRADAALLEAARSLSTATEAALADGSLSSAELDALRADAEALLADIVADPAGLESLSADDLSALATILNSLEDRLRTTEAASTPAFEKVESAAGLAASALRSSNPALIATSSAARDERFLVATAGTQTVAVANAGSVVIEVQSGSLTLVGTSANPGWTVEVESASGRELEADFRNGAQRVQFNAELEDGVLRIRIDTEGASSSGTSAAASGTPSASSSPSSGSSDDDDRDDDDDRSRDESRSAQAPGTTVTYDAAVAGTVAVARSGDTLTIAGTFTNAGWTVEVETATGREVEADFRNGGQRVKFNAELEDGEVRIRVETEGTSSSATPSASSTPSSGSSSSSGSSHNDDDDHDDDNSGSGSGNSGSGSNNSGSGSSNSGSGSGS